MGKILLYYKYVAIELPGAILKWQQKLCSSLGLTGRVIIASEGINGTVGGSDEATEAYQKAMNDHPLFGGIDFKTALGDQTYFPRMRVVVKQEIVKLGIDPAQLSAAKGGTHLIPEQVHELLNKKPDDLVLLDGRNAYESRVGTFAGAVTPDIDAFRQFPDYVDTNANTFKDKTVLMFCTGGIRCERASAYLKEKGVARQVYQLEGGIHRYIEKFPNGHFRGSNYVFDARIAQRVNNDILSICDICHKTPSDFYNNCINTRCNKQFLVCPDCKTRYQEACGNHCFDLIQAGAAKARKKALRPHLSGSCS